MKNIFLQYKIFIYPLVVGIASLILIVFVIMPQLQGYLSGRENLSSSRIRLDNLDAKAETLQNFDHKAYADKLAVVLSSLPVDKDLSTIIGVFRNLTASAGMALSNLKIGGGDGSNSYSITAEVVGPAKNINLLLDVIDNSPRIMKLVSLETNPSGNDLINASVSVDVFYIPAPENLGSVEALLPELTEKDQAFLSSLKVSATTDVGTLPVSQVALPSGKANPFE